MDKKAKNAEKYEKTMDNVARKLKKQQNPAAICCGIFKSIVLINLRGSFEVFFKMLAQRGGTEDFGV